VSAPLRRRKRFAFTWTELFVVLVIVGVLIALLLPAVQQDRSPRRNPCRNNLKQIGLALHNYHDVYGSFPPAITYGPDGKPWHSWRTLLLPFLERQDRYARYRMDEPWNGPRNRELAREIGSLSLFRCHADPDASPGTTSYLAVIGEGTMWPPNGSLTLGDASDGSDRTVHLVEVAASGVQWMEPRDLRLERMTFEVGAKQGVGLRGHGGTGRWFREDDPAVAHVLLLDGSVPVVSSETAPETLRSLLLRNDGGPQDEF
jgi:Protein of unknown function (DUF1559)